MTIKLQPMHGGLHLPDHKAASLTRGLQQASLPEQLIIPLKQHIGDSNKPLVEIGERVSRGQIIAASSSAIGAPVHASSAGTIRDIGSYAVAHPSGQSADCIVIDVDGSDEQVSRTAVDIDQLSVSQLIQRIHRAGIVGLGGASFPASAKMSRGSDLGVDTLIINGVECEPFITCDDILMQTYALDVIKGIGYLQRILEPDLTYIAIEDNKPLAIAAINQALAIHALDHTRVVVIPTRYPSGGEKQLIQILTGREIPKGKLAFDIGLFCQNVGTCVAITRALEQNEPLISRIVTVSGDGITSPGNWEVRLGTPIRHLIQLAGGYVNHQRSMQHLLMGGPMMGFALPGDHVSIVKSSNNILVTRQPILNRLDDHDECIRCSKCSEVCPVQLLPQQLFWHARAKNFTKTEEYHLFDCIECGCCNAVCPSQIPLVQYYRAAKGEIRSAKQTHFKSDRARARFEFREQRLLRNKQLEEERRRLKREAILQKAQARKDLSARPDPIQAALERVKAKKAQALVGAKNTTNLTSHQQRQIDEADARRRTTGTTTEDLR